MKQANQILVEVLGQRISNNKHYSLRAFARDLEISPQQLSNVMNGKRGLGIEKAKLIAQKLDLNDQEKEFFLESLKAKFSRSTKQKQLAQKNLQKLRSVFSKKRLDVDLFKSISRWQTFALLELIKLPKRGGVAWFSKKLGLPVADLQDTLKRLETLQLIKLSRGLPVVNQDVVIADFELPTEAIKNYHKAVLEQASRALYFQNSTERYGSSSTIPIKVKSLERAKQLIQDFRLAFDEEISDQEDADEIYGLSIQFFRLTEPDAQKDHA